jgi:enoyl-CoA hydratase
MPIPESSEVSISRPIEGIGLIRLDAVERKNALNGPMAREITAAVRALDSDPDIGAIVVSGGPEAFCAGADRALLAAAGAGEEAARADLLSVYEIFTALREARAPTLASVCGPAVGAGFNLALACDVRIVGRNAYLRSMFLANSIEPAGGHVRMVLDLGGSELATRLAVFDQPVRGEDAVAAGLAALATDPAEAEERAIGFAKLAAAQPQLSRSIKQSIATVAPLDMAAAEAHEAAAQAAALRRKAEGE